MLSTPPMSIQSAQLTPPTAGAASSLGEVGPHEPMTMPVGESGLHLQHVVVDEYASLTLAITPCNVAKRSGRPARRYMPGGSAVRDTCGARAAVRVQCTEKRRESAVRRDERGCMSGASSGRSE